MNGIIIKNRETYEEITFPWFAYVDIMVHLFYTGNKVFLMQAGGMEMNFADLSETEKEILEAIRADSSIITQFQQSYASQPSSRQTQHDTA